MSYIRIPLLKDIFPQIEKFLKCFLLLCSPVILIKAQHLCIIWVIEAVFQLLLSVHIYHSFLLLCGIVFHGFSEQVKYCIFLQCFDMFVEEIMYWKWNMALLALLIWTFGQHVLFCNIFICFCLHCACTQIIIILIFSLSTDL